MTKQHTYLGAGRDNPRASILRAVLAALAALLVLALPLAPPAKAQLSGLDTEAAGFPDWYQDSNGLKLTGVEAAAEPGAPAGPPETIYWSAVAEMPVGSGGSASLNMDLIGYYANDVTVAGDEITAATIKVNVRGLTPGQVYTITHPYGAKTIMADPQGRIVEVLEETGCDPHVVEAGDPCDFAAALGTSIGPFLVWNPAVGPAAPDGSIGDPDVAHEVIGSPNNTNFFRIDGPGIGGQGVDRAETDLFGITGEVDGLAAFASLEGGTFEAAQSVTLAPSHSGASVFYTTDGSDPATSTTRAPYTGPINIAQTSTLKFVAIDANGQSPVFSERYVITPPTSLTLNASPSALPYGQTATLSGQLTSNGATLAGKTVLLEQQAAGASGFTQSGLSQTTDANGNYSFAVKPNAKTAYRVSFAGEQEGYKPSLSNAQQISMQAVASTTSLTLSKTKVDRSLRQTEIISGKVSPAHAGKRVAITIERYNATKRAYVPVSKTSRVLNAGSAYSYAYKPSLSSPLGTYKVTVKFAGDFDHKPSTATKSFRVVR
jgi:hypothetical protein